MCEKEKKNVAVLPPLVFILDTVVKCMFTVGKFLHVA